MSSRKQDLLHRLCTARTRLLQALSELSDFERETPLLTDMWTARDILAHLAGWAAWDLSATQGMIKADHADFSAVIDVDAFNAKSVAERSNQTWEQLVDEMKQAQASWIELLSALNDRDLFISTRFSSPEWETLADWVHIALEHEIEHAQAIQAWVESRETRSGRGYLEHTT